MTLDVEEPHGGHYKPGPELALVLILPVSVPVQGFGAVKLLTDGAGPLLGQPGLPE